MTQRLEADHAPTSAWRFCPRCGAPLTSPPPSRCGACAYEMFVNARPTASLIILDGDRFLSLRRAVDPGAGEWEVPGGFCDGPEHPADAARREAREELGVDIEVGELLGMYVGHYDFQGERFPILDCYFLATAPDRRFALDPREATEMAWFPVNNPPGMAFETINRALRDAAGRLVS